MNKCDCGAKSLGILEGTPGHSSWCSSLSQEITDKIIVPEEISSVAPLNTAPVLSNKNLIHITGDWIAYDALYQPVDIYNNQLCPNIISISLDSNRGIIDFSEGWFNIGSEILQVWDQTLAKPLIVSTLYNKANISMSVTQELKLVECLKFIWGFKNWP